MHLDRALAQKDAYVSNAKGRQDLKFHLEFEVKHFAGTVKYSIQGFMDKNKARWLPTLIDYMLHKSSGLLISYCSLPPLHFQDSQFHDLKRALFNSSLPILQEMFPKVCMRSTPP